MVIAAAGALISADVLIASFGHTQAISSCTWAAPEPLALNAGRETHVARERLAVYVTLNVQYATSTPSLSPSRRATSDHENPRVSMSLFR